jgi:hypothetical protein
MKTFLFSVLAVFAISCQHLTYANLGTNFDYCNEDNCKLPDCFCGGTTVPGKSVELVLNRHALYPTFCGKFISPIDN